MIRVLRLRILAAGLVFLSFFPSQSSALKVNTINGGGSEVFVDFDVRGAIIPLQLLRSYYSITAIQEERGWNGVFGWGWSSDFETTLTVTPNRTVILRDGGTGVTTQFQASQQTDKQEQNYYLKVKKRYFERKLGRSLKEADLKKYSLPKEFLAQLKEDPAFRLRVANLYGITEDIPTGELFVSAQSAYQTLRFRNNLWERERDGVTQYFDNNGKLVRTTDRSGYYFDYIYSTKNKNQLSEIRAKNKTASLRFTWDDKHVRSVEDNKGNKASYEYDNKENLTKVINAFNQAIYYNYTNPKFPHLLTKMSIEEPGKKGIDRATVIRYNSNGLIEGYQEGDTPAVTITYGKMPDDPANHFFTKTERNASGPNIPAVIYEEFLLRPRPDGEKVLSKQIVKQTFKLGARTQTSTMVTTFSECCGKPLEINRDGKLATFKYYPNGLLKERNDEGGQLRLEYDPKSMKASLVEMNGKVSRFSYDETDTLVSAETGGQRLTLFYDKDKKPFRLVRQKGKQTDEIRLTYAGGNQPSTITMKDVASLRISYDNDSGRITDKKVYLETGNRTPSAEESKRLNDKIVTTFNEMMEIVRPAAFANNSGSTPWERF